MKKTARLFLCVLPITFALSGCLNGTSSGTLSGSLNTSYLATSSDATKTFTWTITNNDSSAASNLTLSTSGLSVGTLTTTASTCSGTVNPGESCTFTLSFTSPSVTSAENETLTLTYGSASSSLPIAIYPAFYTAPQNNNLTLSSLPAQTVNSITQNNGVTYIGTNSGLFISTDNGQTYHSYTTANGLGDNGTYKALIDNNLLFVATQHGISIATLDSSGLPNSNFTNYALHVSGYAYTINDLAINNNTLYAAGQGTVFLATINSNPTDYNFSAFAPFTTSMVSSIAVLSPTDIYAAISSPSSGNPGLFHYNGSSFTGVTGSTSDSLNNILIANGYTYITGLNSTSSQNGLWVLPTGDDLNSATFYPSVTTSGLGISPQKLAIDNNILYVGTASGLDQATLNSSGQPNSFLTDPIIPYGISGYFFVSGNTILAGIAGSVGAPLPTLYGYEESTNGGSNFTFFPGVGSSYPGSNTSSLFVNTSNGEDQVYLTANSNAAISTNGGQSFDAYTPTIALYQFGSILSYSSIYNDGSTTFIGTLGTGAGILANGIFEPISGISSTIISAITGNNTNTYFLAPPSSPPGTATIYTRSNNNGAISSFTISDMYSPKIAVSDTNIYIANSTGSSISVQYTPTTNPSTWASLDTSAVPADAGVSGISVTGNTVYLATSDGLYVSTENAAFSLVSALTAPTATQRTFAEQQLGGCSSGPFAHSHLGLGANAVVFSVYATGQSVYVVTTTGVFISHNSGESFDQYTASQGLSTNSINCTPLPIFATSNAVYVGTRSGLSKLDL